MKTMIRTAGVMTLAAFVATPVAAQQGPNERDLRALAEVGKLILEQLPRPARPPRPPDPEVRVRQGAETNEMFSRTVRLGGDGLVEIQNLAGNVVVNGGGGNDVVIQAVKRAYGGSEEQRRARLQAVQIRVEEQGSRLEIETEYPNSTRNVNVIVDYTIRVPQNASVSVESVSGRIRVNGMRGEVNLQSVSGDIDAGNIRGRAAELTTVSGNLMMTDFEASRVEARTVSGDLAYTGRLQRNGRYELTSQSGDITLRVRADDGFSVNASTFSGDIRSDFPVTIGPSRRDDSRRRGLGQTIRGTFEDGSAILDLRTFSGDITLGRR